MNAITQINQIQHNAERLLLLAAGLSCLCLGVLYMYFLSGSVVHVVMSKEAEANISEVSSDIAQLESKYMEIQNSLSDQVVEQSGYIATEEKIFIDKSNASLVTKR